MVKSENHSREKENNNMAINYDAAEKAEYSKNGRFFTPGRHLVRILTSKEQTSRKDGHEMQVVEFEVVHSQSTTLGVLTAEEVAAGKLPTSLSESLPSGDMRTWLMKDSNKQMFLSMVKQFFDAVKGSVRAMTLAVPPEGDQSVITAEEAAALVTHEGRQYGFDLSKPGAVADEMRAINGAPQLASSLPIWVNCNRIRTQKGLVIDAVQFDALSKEDVLKYGSALELL
jgi:hypothetical protein